MKIYKMTVKVYTYWKNAYESGWMKEEKFFTTNDKAIAWKNELENKWYDIKGKLVEIDEEWKKPYFEMTEIEVE